MKFDMDSIIWLVIMIPSSALFTGIGIFAWNRKKPMWFWSGSTVKETEISNIPAYNHANGLMWIGYSLIFWLAAFAGLWNMTVAGILVGAGCVAGIPVLILIYNRIYKKYKA